MSIYERTKEIGVMKVIGANLADIRRMFLLEAGLIGFLGGLIGVILSFIISLLLNTALAGIVLGAFLGGMMGGGSNISIIPGGPLWADCFSLQLSALFPVTLRQDGQCACRPLNLRNE